MEAPTIPIVGTVVTQLRFDFAFTLAFDADIQIRIETGFTVASPGGELETFDPEADLARMGSLLTLHQAEVRTAGTDEIGNLRLDFSDGRALQCRPHQQYEAWNLSGKDGLLYVCLPGGGLAIWSARTS